MKYVLLDTTRQGGGKHRCASKDVGLCCFLQDKEKQSLDYAFTVTTLRACRDLCDREEEGRPPPLKDQQPDKYSITSWLKMHFPPSCLYVSDAHLINSY